MPHLQIPGWPPERLEAHATIVLDGSGAAIYASEAFLRLSGLPIDRVIGSSGPHDAEMARIFEGGRDFLLSGSMARLRMSSGEVHLPARPAPIPCRFTYEGVPKGAPEYHVFVFERIESQEPQNRALRMEKALYEIRFILDRVGLGNRREPSARREMVDPVELASLTSRELDVVKLLLEGGSNDQIARQLHVSLHTVKSHTKAIFRKLGVGSRSELLARFVQAG